MCLRVLVFQFVFFGSAVVLVEVVDLFHRVAMGARLSTTQKEVYYKVVGVFTVFSKGKFKKFLRKLSLHFPHTPPGRRGR